MNNYKYIAGSSSVPYFLKGCIKFTPIPELNDPSELTSNVILDDVLHSLERLRTYGYSKEDLIYLQQQSNLLQILAPGFQAIDVPQSPSAATTRIRSPFYDRIPLLLSLLEQTANAISSKVGIFCLSKRFDSLPMWAHYADNASGLVVEFVDLEKDFSGDSTGILKKPVNVRYERERNSITFEPQSHESLFFDKFQDWGYEQEVRIVMPLKECNVVNSGSHQLYLYNIPVERVSRLILGWRMADTIVDEIIKQVSLCEHRIEVIRSKISKGRVILENI
ncbi:MAG TPA: DUF2971 domain-containing protein [Methylotenera sp.]|nr:DUF2971 domain-containing protein [Methylotenera sp.]